MENMGMGGRPAYTVEETRLAIEWRERSLALCEKYKEELTAAGDDWDKKRPIVKLIYEEVGPVPLPIKITMSAGLPIVILLLKYEKELEEAERNPFFNPDDAWTCSCCQSINSGKYCKECGALRPKE